MPMFNLWRNWIDTGLFAAEAQCVIALRMMRIASGHPGSRRRNSSHGVRKIHGAFGSPISRRVSAR
jgi:hypothetical protein